MDPTGREDDPARDAALVVALVSGSHVVNHLYLVLFPPILATLAADFGVGLAALGDAIVARYRGEITLAGGGSTGD